VTAYRVTLGAFTTTGRPLTTERIEIPDADEVGQALDLARREFFGRTALVSGVRLVTEEVERRRGEGYQRLIPAYRAMPGTWIKLESVMADGQSWFGWRRVDHWEPQGDGTCRLVTTDRRNPHGGFYTREHVFETR